MHRRSENRDSGGSVDENSCRHSCRWVSIQRLILAGGTAPPSAKPQKSGVSLITDTSTLKQYLLASPATSAQRTLYSVTGLKYPSRTRELATPDQLP